MITFPCTSLPFDHTTCNSYNYTHRWKVCHLKIREEIHAAAIPPCQLLWGEGRLTESMLDYLSTNLNVNIGILYYGRDGAIIRVLRAKHFNPVYSVSDCIGRNTVVYYDERDLEKLWEKVKDKKCQFCGRHPYNIYDRYNWYQYTDKSCRQRLVCSEECKNRMKHRLQVQDAIILANKRRKEAESVKREIDRILSYDCAWCGITPKTIEEVSSHWKRHVLTGRLLCSENCTTNYVESLKCERSLNRSRILLKMTRKALKSENPLSVLKSLAEELKQQTNSQSSCPV